MCLQMEEYERRKGKEKKIEIRIGIGEKSRIKRAIVDKNARIGKNVMVTIYTHIDFNLLKFNFFSFIFCLKINTIHRL